MKPLFPLLCASACLLLGLPSLSRAAPVANVLARPALAVDHAERSTLLGASQSGDRLIAVGERGVAVYSTDQGATWQQGRVPVSVTLTAVQAMAGNLAYAVGHGGVVLVSNDGGANWRKLVDGLQLAAVALNAAKASGNADALKDAERLVADGADKPLLDLHFFDARRGIVVGAFNLAFATEDGGANWQPISDRIDNPQALHLYGLRALGDTLLMVGEQGLVYRSTDAGRNFKRLVTPYKGSFFVAEMNSDQDFVVAGLRGNAWHTSDAGASWNRIDGQMPVSFTASARSGNGSVLLGNQAGGLFAFGAGQWKALPTRLAPPLNAVLPLKDGRLLALGRAGAVVVPMSAQGASQ